MKNTAFNSAKYGPLALVTDAADPVQRPAAEALERNNLAVYAALNEPRAFARIERLFELSHSFYHCA
jgi:hypothetical protein